MGLGPSFLAPNSVGGSITFLATSESCCSSFRLAPAVLGWGSFHSVAKALTLRIPQNDPAPEALLVTLSVPTGFGRSRQVATLAERRSA